MSTYRAILIDEDDRDLLIAALTDYMHGRGTDGPDGAERLDQIIDAVAALSVDHADCEREAATCPHCAAEIAHGRMAHIDGDRARHETTCPACGTGWHDYYDWTGREIWRGPTQGK